MSTSAGIVAAVKKCITFHTLMVMCVSVCVCVGICLDFNIPISDDRHFPDSEAMPVAVLVVASSHTLVARNAFKAV